MSTLKTAANKNNDPDKGEGSRLVELDLSTLETIVAAEGAAAPQLPDTHAAMQMIIVAAAPNAAHIEAPAASLVPATPDAHGATSGPQGLDLAVAKTGFVDAKSGFVDPKSGFTDPKSGLPDSKPNLIDKKTVLDKKDIEEIEKHFREHNGPKGPQAARDPFKLSMDSSYTGKGSAKTHEYDLMKPEPKWEHKTSAGEAEKKIKTDAEAKAKAEEQKKNAAERAEKAENYKQESAQKADQQAKQKAATDKINTTKNDNKAAFDENVKAKIDQKKLEQKVVDTGKDAKNAADVAKNSTQTAKLEKSRLDDATQTAVLQNSANKTQSADKPQSSVKADDPRVKPAYDSYVHAEKNRLADQAAADRAQTVHTDAKQKLADGVKTTEKAGQTLTKTDDALSQARKAGAADGVRDRANTMPAKSSSEKNSSDKPGPAKTGDQQTETRPRANSTAANITAKPDVVKPEAPKPVESKFKKETDKLHAEIKKDTWKYGVVQPLGNLLADNARQTAIAEQKTGGKSNNPLHSSSYAADGFDRVLAGGVTTETTANGTKTTINHVKATGQAEYFRSDSVMGGSASVGIRAETGSETTTHGTNAFGQATTSTDKAYLGVAADATSSFVFTPTHVQANAAVKVSVDGEIRHTDTTKIGDVDVSTSKYAGVHGDAGASAGFKLGLYGVEVKAKVSASVSAEVGTSADAKIGDVKASIDAKVFAEAKAEAGASAEVNFNPLEGVAKVKVDVGAMASAGIGAGVKTGLFDTKTGAGVGGGVGVTVAAVGAKCNPDINIKDGKLNMKVDMSLALGVGVDISFEMKGDLNKAKNNFTDAVTDWKKPIPALWFASAIVGFFS